MQHLHSNHKRNVLAGAARAFGVLRPDGSDSLFPTSRMPFGMLGTTQFLFSMQAQGMRFVDAYMLYVSENAAFGYIACIIFVSYSIDPIMSG